MLCHPLPNRSKHPWKNHSCMATPRCWRLQGERGGHKVPRVRRAVKAAALRGQRQATGGRASIHNRQSLGSMVKLVAWLQRMLCSRKQFTRLGYIGVARHFLYCFFLMIFLGIWNEQCQAVQHEIAWVQGQYTNDLNCYFAWWESRKQSSWIMDACNYASIDSPSLLVRKSGNFLSWHQRAPVNSTRFIRIQRSPGNHETYLALRLTDHPIIFSFAKGAVHD